VKTAKPKVKADLIAVGVAFRYSEPEKEVISRSGDKCVVCRSEQWNLKYGESEWQAQAMKCLANMETYSKESRAAFEFTLGWLEEWACCREFGLGSRLPWDEKYFVESLSDSTIYMAYYTVAHLLQGGTLDGHEVGPAGIKASKLTDAVWDYIFLEKPYPEDCGIPEATLARLRREFEYWYPVDLRVSGKDLIQNHLTMFIYNHVAIFPEVFI